MMRINMISELTSDRYVAAKDMRPTGKILGIPVRGPSLFDLLRGKWDV